MQNLQIFKSVQLYIKRTKRFTHLWSHSFSWINTDYDVYLTKIISFGNTLVNVWWCVSQGSYFQPNVHRHTYRAVVRLVKTCKCLDWMIRLNERLRLRLNIFGTSESSTYGKQRICRSNSASTHFHVSWLSDFIFYSKPLYKSLHQSFFYSFITILPSESAVTLDYSTIFP
jgi:hypothetical protein